jgi:monofunctional glycosyltransferase
MAHNVEEGMEETQTKSTVLSRPRAVVLVVIAVGLWWWAGLYSTFTLPNVSALRSHNPTLTAFMRQSTGDIHYTWAPLEGISQSLQRAVVAAEDDQFYHHPGFDWVAIKRAAQVNWRRKRFAFGASTITQQLAKNLYLSATKSPYRKGKELLIAIRLEHALSKQRILELYLNVVEWGDGIFGAEAAAQHYFRKSAKALGPRESAFLASILPNPQKLGQRGFRMTKRAARILRRM